MAAMPIHSLIGKPRDDRDFLSIPVIDASAGTTRPTNGREVHALVIEPWAATTATDKLRPMLGRSVFLEGSPGHLVPRSTRDTHPRARPDAGQGGIVGNLGRADLCHPVPESTGIRSAMGGRVHEPGQCVGVHDKPSGA